MSDLDPTLERALRNLAHLVWNISSEDPRPAAEGLFAAREDPLRTTDRIHDTWESFLGDPKFYRNFHFIQDPTLEQEEAVLEYCRETEKAMRCHHKHEAYEVEKGYGIRAIRVCVVTSTKSPQLEGLLKYIHPTGAPTDWLDYEAPTERVLDPKELNRETCGSFDAGIKLRSAQSVLVEQNLVAEALVSTRRRRVGMEKVRVTQEDYDRAVATWTETRESSGLTAGLGV